MKYTKDELSKRGYEAVEAERPLNPDDDAACTGCVFDHKQHLGIKCGDVPCSRWTMGADVICLHKARK